MCLVCEEYSKGKLKTSDALKNLEEMKSTMDIEHYDEVHSEIYLDRIEEELEEYWKSIDFGD